MSRALLAATKSDAGRKPIVTPAPAGLLQRACDCGGSPGLDGDCAECRTQRLQRSARGAALMPKLAVSKPSDSLEREADRIADALVAGQVTKGHGSASNPALQRCGSTPSSACPCHEAPPVVGQVLRSPGQPLDTATRAYMEPRFGHDFGSVRVHTDARAAESTRGVNALAYTVGRDVVFGEGQYAPGIAAGQRLLAHELTHVVQQGAVNGTAAHLMISSPQGASEHEAHAVADRVVRDDEPVQPSSMSVQPSAQLQRVTRGAVTTGAGTTSSPATSGGTSPTRHRRLNVDVLAAEDPDDFLVRAAAHDLGTDIRVRSMNDMVAQVAGLATEGSCVASLEIFNHANPEIQTVAGGNKVKLPSGELRQQPLSGFSLSWLFNSANDDALNRLRSSFCCNGETRWFGCSTAGVLAEGGQRTEEELRASKGRYTHNRAEFYQSVEDAAAHGATRFRAIGSVNVQSWANALCTPITAATDFNSWNVTGSGYTRTVIYGGQQVRVPPQADAGCACDPETGRISGATPTTEQMRQRATELREQALRPAYERTRSVIGRDQPPVAESAEQRATRESFEAAQREYFEQLENTIRESVLGRAGFARRARPTTPEEALRVVTLWGLDIGRIASALPTLTASLSGMLRGERGADDLAQRQRALEAALTPQGRETFLSALYEVRRDRLWNEHFTRNTIYIFPDLSGVNRYRGYTQTGTRTNEEGRSETVHVIHISRDLLNSGQTELVTANLIHELTHTAHEPNVVGRAMESFTRDLAELLADHPQIATLRSSATDAVAARSTHVSRIRQMLYEVTGYAEAEIFAHLEQLTHQPAMTIDGTAVSATHFILEEVTRHIARLRRIGMPTRTLAGILGSIRRRTMLLYDRRIAATAVGSTERRQMEVNKRLAESIFHLAVTLSEEVAE